ncbi:hypothetical protein [Ornithobacterium rhinotracheale]|uniref:hypothetical protein n=1 Tax=Ornithobacterium rhinotracheale TaxID=28251 RepID=UPI001FF4F0AB|nr:hypothetical protein [Ornithobacterium rhinotracheale]MCK0206076.1 hypothetical protein [Ornithobacterium rhinotracheale]
MGTTDLIPLWVADMDFKTPKFVVEAVQNRLNNEIFGYTSASEDWYHAIIDWQKRKINGKSQEMISFVPKWCQVYLLPCSALHRLATRCLLCLSLSAVWEIGAQSR